MEDRIGRRLVVVDDEPEIRDTVADYLGRNGYFVRACASGAELDSLLAEEPADLLLLDVAMPGEDGFSIARRLHADAPIPILMLSGVGEVVDRVIGLEIGADDFVSKPFDPRELLARVRAVLRRAGERARPPMDAAAPRLVGPAPKVAPAPTAPLIELGKVALDLEARCLVAKDGARTPLTTMEFDLLHAFARHPNRVLSRERLLDIAHNKAEEPFDRSIDIRVTRLRKKIEIDAAKPQVIKTVRGAGYIFVPPKR